MDTLHREIRTPNSGRRQGGGWITFPFIIGTLAGLTLAGGGWAANLIVYLIQEFNLKSIDAAQVSNIVNGGSSLFPIVGAIIADSFLGCFFVVSIFSCISLLGTGFLALTATLNSLRPQPCNDGGISFCKAPLKIQFLVLYAGIALATIGLGGTRFSLATMGANQFHKPQEQGSFFNWYFFTLYTASVVSSTAIVYIEDNVSWGLGFGVCVAANFIGLAIFLLGNRFYLHDKPQGSPFMNIARVPVAAFKKRNLPLSSTSHDYYNEPTNQPMNVEAAAPKKGFRFLNRASLKAEGDIGSDGSIAKPWSLCTVQHVEDLKSLIRIFPLWSSSIFLSIPIAIQGSLTILQALSTDRHLGQHFKIPAGSVPVIVLISTSIFLTLIDRFLCPMWQKLTRKPPSALQRIGVGHVLNVLGMAVSALVESKRLKMVHAHNLRSQPSSIVPMSALWLFPQLVLVGVGEAFHFPGQVALYYQEFPASLRSTATAMIAMILGIAYYLSTAIIDLLRRVTSWLPDNINNGRLDTVYWTLTVVGVLNFGYFLACASLYKYQNAEKEVDDSSA
ncbi:PREDICTED: protein NRT1/ PTR FAMILY 2.7 [Theobroma cacao]|uniref:Protein NRT1/ PTR FAMILY 2.7 n=1 Tax=Theobroma cacao TaxID=3641 RepID=A0AB32WX85_THECC|nr:PREDICTED: protein NRT1/ PTR FAMILY 2.7 [Theobroma cacao]